MRRIVYADPERVGRWVQERGGGVFSPETMTAVGLEKDGELVIGVTFDQFRGRSIAMHVAVADKAAATRSFIRFCFAYAFNTCGVNTVIGYVDSANEAAQQLDEHLGFTLQAVIPDAGPKGDLLIYTMTRRECRFLGGEHGRF